MEGQERHNGNKVLLTVIGAATFLTAMVGATFAYFSATQTSETKTITTATTSLQVNASNVTVSDIRPTTWDATKRDTDGEIIKTTATVTGTSTTNGRYSLYLDHSAIAIGSSLNQGAVADFKYAVYDKTGNQIVAPTSFTSDATTGTGGYLIPGNNLSGYTAAYPTSTNGSTVNINDTYDVYIWIENAASEQNNLQDVTFNVSFTVSGTSL